MKGKHVTNINYSTASDQERMQSIFPGDPVGDYKGFPEIQRMILDEENLVKAEIEEYLDNITHGWLALGETAIGK